ncbi:MAG: hypothetical protein H0X25_05580 [Acidobacteriales bacterium]|nr:hypothetical protein [Terriglobales bacterium]
MSGLGFDDSMPGVIDAKSHGIIDYVHTATNFLVGAIFHRRGDKAAAYGAYALGASVLLNALMTDYPLGVFKAWSFKVHGALDYGVAAASAAIPSIVDVDDSAATFFRIQGAGESLIAGLTNYDDKSGSERARRSAKRLFRKAA